MKIVFDMMSDSYSTYYSCVGSAAHSLTEPIEISNCSPIFSEPAEMTPEDAASLIAQVDRKYDAEANMSTSYGKTTAKYSTQREEIMQHALAPPSPVSILGDHDTIARRIAPILKDTSTPTPKTRNLVVCIDGTSNQFGMMVRQ